MINAQPLIEPLHMVLRFKYHPKNFIRFGDDCCRRLHSKYAACVVATEGVVPKEAVGQCSCMAAVRPMHARCLIPLRCGRRRTRSERAAAAYGVETEGVVPMEAMGEAYSRLANSRSVGGAVRAAARRAPVFSCTALCLAARVSRPTIKLSTSFLIY